MRLYQKLALLSIALLAPVFAYARLPNDPNVEQWSYKDTEAYKAWDITIGSRDVIVAIIDNGFDTFNPDLWPNVWINEDEIADNGIDDDRNRYIDDVYGWDFGGVDRNGDGLFEADELKGDNDPRPDITFGGPETIYDEAVHHATVVAGIIGAVGNNGRDGAGINWRVRLMNVKALEQSGRNDLEALTSAIRYAVDNGADVINISLVGDTDERIKDVIKYAFDRGVAVVAAAGNNHSTLNQLPLYPICADAEANEQWLLGVSAINERHYLAGFSNIGSACIDITAPGVNIAGALRYAPRYGLLESYGGKWQGTSFASPFVAGTAALIKAIQPSWGPKEIYDAILKTVHRTPPKDPAGYRQLYGAGLLQIGSAVAYAAEQKPKAPAISSLLFADLVRGAVTEHDISSNAVNRRTETALTAVNEAAYFADGFATFRRVNKSVGEIVLYDRNWRITAHWLVASTGEMSLVVGDVQGSQEPEIILAPKFPAKETVRIFSLEGELIRRLDSAEKHTGVSIALRREDGINNILVLVRENGALRLSELRGDLTLRKKIEIDGLGIAAGPVAAEDIDGDGEAEYIAGSAAGAEPFVAYYDADGTLLRKFYVYDGGYLGGFRLDAGDYDRDGKADVIVVPKDSKQEARVWNNWSQKLAGFPLSGDDLRVMAR